MEDHELRPFDNFDPYCPYVCEREELVAATLQLVLEKRVVVIRATPQVGKTTLLNLLGRHIRDNVPSLEPAFIDWKPEQRRGDQEYPEYLKHQAKRWRIRNAGHRASNPDARTIFLIDEAQESYDEGDFWSRCLKQVGTRSQPLFILVCVYGSTTTLLTGMNEKSESKAMGIDQSQRIELRPTVPGGLCMRFTPKETEMVVNKWALDRDNRYELKDGVCEYIHMATSGHPGMVGMLLQCFNIRFPQVNTPSSLMTIGTSLTIFRS